MQISGRYNYQSYTTRGSFHKCVIKSVYTTTEVEVEKCILLLGQCKATRVYLVLGGHIHDALHDVLPLPFVVAAGGLPGLLSRRLQILGQQNCIKVIKSHLTCIKEDHLY